VLEKSKLIALKPTSSRVLEELTYDQAKNIDKMRSQEGPADDDDCDKDSKPAWPLADKECTAKLMDPRTATGRGVLINAISRSIDGEIPMGDTFINAVISRIVGSHRGVGGVVKDIRTAVISQMNEVKDSQKQQKTRTDDDDDDDDDVLKEFKAPEKRRVNKYGVSIYNWCDFAEARLKKLKGDATIHFRPSRADPDLRMRKTAEGGYECSKNPEKIIHYLEEFYTMKGVTANRPPLGQEPISNTVSLKDNVSRWYSAASICRRHRDMENR
jgi:hypothetical protein